MEIRTTAKTGTAVPCAPELFARLSLRTNFAWTLAGNVVYSACQWGMLVVLARMASPATVGRFALVFAIAAPIFMLTNLQLRAVQATDAKQDNAFSDYLALRLVTVGIAFAIVGGAMLALRLPGAVAAVLAAVAAAKGMDSISDTFYGLLQQHERMDRIAISMMIKGMLSLAVFAALMWLIRSLLVATASLAVVWGLVTAAYDVPSGARVLTAGGQSQRELRPRWRSEGMGRLACLTLPLGFVMMLVSLNTSIPRYAIERYLGEHDLGVFAAVTALLVVGSTVVGALGQSASPRMALHYAAGDRRAFAHLTVRLLVISAVIGAAGMVVVALWGKLLLGAVYGPAYADHVTLFVWTAAAAAVAYLQSSVGYAVTSARCFRAQVPLLGGVSAVVIVCCAVLVPVYGLTGAAIALGISSLVHLAGNTALVVAAMARLKRPEVNDG